MLVGSFNYQISDGSLPYDKTAELETWKEILFGVAKEPELRMEYSIAKIFQHVAELGGAKNIDSFKKQAMPPSTNTVNGVPLLAGAAMDPAAGGMMPLAPAQPTMPF